MHGHVPYDVFLQQLSGFLGSYYIFLALMNGLAAYLLWQQRDQRPLFRLPLVDFPVTAAFLWLLVSLFFLMLAPLVYRCDVAITRLISVPDMLRTGINRALNPTVYTLGSLALMSVLFYFRRFFVKPWVAWSMLNLSLLLMGLSMTNP